MKERIHPRLNTSQGEVQAWFPKVIPFYARLLNLSEGGCLLSIKATQTGKHLFRSIFEGVKVADQGRMMLLAQGRGATLCLNGIVRSRSIFRDREIRIGMHFLPTEDQRAALKRDLFSLAHKASSEPVKRVAIKPRRA